MAFLGQTHGPHSTAQHHTALHVLVFVVREETDRWPSSFKRQHHRDKMHPYIPATSSRVVFVGFVSGVSTTHWVHYFPCALGLSPIAALLHCRCTRNTLSTFQLHLCSCFSRGTHTHAVKIHAALSRNCVMKIGLIFPITFLARAVRATKHTTPAAQQTSRRRWPTLRAFASSTLLSSSTSPTTTPPSDSGRAHFSFTKDGREGGSDFPFAFLLCRFLRHLRKTVSSFLHFSCSLVHTL